MQYRNTYHKICVMCGKPFEHGRSNKNCCSPECTYQKKLQNYREYNARLRKAEAEALNSPPRKARYVESLAEVNAKARAAGMSYGQYMLARRAANG